MNQHDQMLREALLAAEELAEEANGNGNGWNEWCLPRLKKIQEVLAHVNETPKNEHDIAEGFILAADPAAPEPVFHDCTFCVGPKLVRLNDDALVNIYLECKAEWKATNKRQRQRIAVVFGNALMDAMERVNGGLR